MPMFSRYFQPYGFLRRLPVSERQRVDVTTQLRYADVAVRLAQPALPADDRLSLLIEKATIDSLAGRLGFALDSLHEAAALAAPDGSERHLGVVYTRAKVLNQGARYVEAATDLESVIGAPAAPDMLRRRAGLHLGRIFLERGRFAEAIDTLRRALRGGGHARKNALAGLYDLAYGYLHEAMYADADAALAEAERLVGPEDVLDRARLAYYRGWIAFARRQVEAAAQLFGQARRIFVQHEDVDAIACADLSLACVDFERADLDACIARCERAQEAALRPRHDIWISMSLLWARALFVAGRFAEAIGEYRRAEAQSKAAGRPDLECRALEGISEVHAFRGEVEPATEAIEASLRLRRRCGDQLGEAVDLANLGNVRRQLGRYQEAFDHYAEARAIASAIGNRYELARIAAEEMELHIGRGELARAEQAAKEAARRYEAIGDVLRLSRVVKHLGQIASLRDDFARAEAWFDEALKFVSGDPNRVLQAEVYASRAETRADRGASEDAQRDLAHARELAERTGATYLVDALRRRGEELRERDFARTILGRYVDPKVVARLLARGPRRLAENVQQQVTILFSDIRGYSALTERLNAREVVQLLNDHFEAMVEEVLNHGGMIDKFIGDAVMAVFGDPGSPRPDDAARAVRAAIAMTRRRHAMNVERRQLGLPPVEVGCGIDTGEVVMGNIGSSRRVAYTVIGDAVNVASRLEGLTKGYGRSILVSGATRARAGDAARTVALGTQTVKGREEPVEVFAVEVDGLESEPKPAPAPASASLAVPGAAASAAPSS